MKLPTRKETLIVTCGVALFFLSTGLFIGLRFEHFALMALFLALFFASTITRKLAIALLPFMVFAISYDWMRVFPNYEMNPIDVKGLYEAEKHLFGIQSNGQICDGLSIRYFLPLLGSCAHSLRCVSLPEGRAGVVLEDSIGLSVCESYWVRRVLCPPGCSTLVCDVARFRTDPEHAWRDGRFGPLRRRHGVKYL